MVRTKGLEPPRLASLEPKSSASTNSATPACHNPLHKARAPSISQFSPQPRIGACKYCGKAWARWLRPPRSPRGLGCSLLQGMGAENQRANGTAAGGSQNCTPEAARTARRETAKTGDRRPASQCPAKAAGSKPTMPRPARTTRSPGLLPSQLRQSIAQTRQIAIVPNQKHDHRNQAQCGVEFVLHLSLPEPARPRCFGRVVRRRCKVFAKRAVLMFVDGQKLMSRTFRPGSG